MTESKSVALPLGYSPIFIWRSGRDSNPRPPAWQAGILTNWTTGPYKIKNKSDPYGIRTRVTAVKGRCLNRLTNGPLFKWRRRRDSNPRAAYATYTLSRGASWASWVLPLMAPQVGFEPTTDRLTADSSTTELLRNNTCPSQAKSLPLDSTLYIIFIV